MASNSSKGGLEGDENPWGPPLPPPGPVPDLLDTSPDMLQQETEPEPEPDQPPEYSDNNAQPATPSRRTTQIPLPYPTLPFQKYIIPASTTSPDRITVTTRHPPFYDDAGLVLKFLKEQIALPLKPVIQVVGKTQLPGYTVKDFDFKLNLTSLLVRGEGKEWAYVKFPDPASVSSSSLQQPGPSYKRLSQPPPPVQQPIPPQSLATLAHAFASSTSPSKSLTLTRSPLNLDTSYLQGQILALLAQIGYRGTVTISFPNEHSTLVIQKGTALAQSWRSVLNTATSWIGGKPAPKPTAYSVEVVWPFATEASGLQVENESDDATATAMGGGEARGVQQQQRKCAVQSEVEWWKTWSGVVRNAILSGKRGWVGYEDWVEARMGWREEDRKGEWGGPAHGSSYR